MKLLGIRPAGEAGHRVELPKQLSHQLIGILFGAQLIEAAKHQCQGTIRVRNGALGEVFTLSAEALPVPDELGAIEVGSKTDRSAQNPIGADDACHATPRVDHLVGKNSVNGKPNACQTGPWNG